nr:sugar-binding domain-containing protein [uncultured Sphaerochaeta sp.]
MSNTRRAEYPRPDFQRSQWQNLNGVWDFAFDDEDKGKEERWYERADFANTQIVVPFVYQCAASTIADLSYHPIFWYSRLVAYEEDAEKLRSYLCFAAVDHEAEVWVNGRYMGSHRGGYTPFSFDVTDALHPGTDNLVVVRCEDRNDCSQVRGKQYWKTENDRCWYTPSSGIWQTVWLEKRPEVHISSFELESDIDTSMLSMRVILNRKPYQPCSLTVDLSKGGVCVQHAVLSMHEQTSQWKIPVLEDDYIDEIHYWTPERPSLYDIDFTLACDQQVDEVHAYFGMRKISIRDGHVLLNNKPFYQRLVLDQAYWEETLLTAPSDEAFKQDIERIKQMGFNGVRLHQKIEDSRFYYWADVLGLVVWAELPSTYSFNPVARQLSIESLTAFIERDRNHPCIICWVPLNESWGVRNIYANEEQQRFAVALYHLVKMLDGSRMVNTNDGWEQVSSDLCGVHDYIPDGERFSHVWKDLESLLEGTVQGRMIYASGYSFANQPIMVTEFGGIAFNADMVGSHWGYAGGVEDERQFLSRLRSLITAIRSKKEIQGFCYTQLTDVMQEVNGLLRIDRSAKCSPEEIRSIITS